MNQKPMIPVSRILQKLDQYFEKNDLTGAGRHLETWLSEASALHDRYGQILMLNELLGIYRKTGRREKALETADSVLQIMQEENLSDSLSGATYRINCATVYTAFGDHEKALRLFEEAKQIYESAPGVPLEQMGSLYNNMAMACLSLSRYTIARELSQKSLYIMRQSADTLPEQAITWLNLANIAEAQQGLEEGWLEIETCLLTAIKLLDSPDNCADSAYAFACNKCAPVFDYYGYFMYAIQLKERAKKIYERS